MLWLGGALAALTASTCVGDFDGLTDGNSGGATAGPASSSSSSAVGVTSSSSVTPSGAGGGGGSGGMGSTVSSAEVSSSAEQGTGGGTVTASSGSSGNTSTASTASAGGTASVAASAGGAGGTGGMAGSGGAASSSIAGGPGTGGQGGAASASTGTGGAGGAPFPATPLLDDFNRADGSVGNNWIQQTPDGFQISSQALVWNGAASGTLLWPTQFGATQEAFVTVPALNELGDEFDLLLKAQTDIAACDAIWLSYNRDAGPRVLQLKTCESDISTNSGFVVIGGVSLTLSPGDQLGARSYPDGTLEAYVNHLLLASWSIAGWKYAASGGRIGLVAYTQPSVCTLDDFGGGTLPATSP